MSFDITDNGKLIRDILSHKKVILTGTKGKDRLYHLDKPHSQKSTDTSYAATEPPRSKLEDLHFCLGHLNYRSVKAMVQKGMVTGVKLTKRDLKIEPPVCASCVKGKMTRASFLPSESGKASQILGRVHSDLWGPAQVRTKEGHRYLMTLTDHKTRWVWKQFLKCKSKAFALFKEWLVQVERETGKKLKVFHCDGGGEFFPTVWKEFMKERGIRVEFTSADTPEQNGASERLNRTLFDHVQTCLIDSKLPLFLWAQCVNYMVYTKNRNTTSALTNQTPYV